MNDGSLNEFLSNTKLDGQNFHILIKISMNEKIAGLESSLRMTFPDHHSKHKFLF